MPSQQPSDQSNKQKLSNGGRIHTTHAYNTATTTTQQQQVLPCDTPLPGRVVSDQKMLLRRYNVHGQPTLPTLPTLPFWPFWPVVAFLLPLAAPSAVHPTMAAGRFVFQRGADDRHCERKKRATTTERESNAHNRWLVLQVADRLTLTPHRQLTLAPQIPIHPTLDKRVSGRRPHHSSGRPQRVGHGQHHACSGRRTLRRSTLPCPT